MAVITERMGKIAVEKIGFPLRHEMLQMSLTVDIDIDRTHTYPAVRGQVEKRRII